MKRLTTLACAAAFIALFGASGDAYAQCTSVIPGLPDVGSVPCSEAFTPNTPSNPSDGPNAPGSPNEAKHENDSCDGDFMNQIYARSYLEANREIMISALLVRKPDSVLEYTCFDGQVKRTAETAGLIFSETNLWLGSGGGSYSSVSTPDGSDIDINVYTADTYLDVSLNRLVMQGMSSFVNSNFDHEFLGGSAGISSDVKASVGAASLACSNMRDVYELAKCKNINPATFFMTFEDIVAADPRDSLPSGQLQCGGINPITSAAIAVANNDGGTYALKDNIVTYSDMFIPSSSGTCAEPVPTGVMVKQEKFSYGTTGTVTLVSTRQYAEYVCPTPGCYYEPSGSSVGTCKDAP